MLGGNEISGEEIDPLALWTRLVDIVLRELPWASDQQAQRTAYHAQDLAEDALAILVQEPGQTLTEKEQAEFVFWTADTQLMLATTQIKEWGLDLPPMRLPAAEEEAEASRDDFVEMMLRAGFILKCLGDLPSDDEEKMRQLGGDQWLQAVRNEMQADEAMLMDLHSFLRGNGMSTQQALSFILAGFRCSMSSIMLAGGFFGGLDG
jgi:hypothetical protein